MEAVRASTETGSVVKIVVEELEIVDAEVLGTWCNNTMRAGIVELLLCIFSSANDHATNDLRVAINDIFSQGELYTS